MNLLVKRFLVLALPLMILGSSSESGYGICVENNSGIQLEDLSIVSGQQEFLFGDVGEGGKTGLGNADLQFCPNAPQKLEVVFKPKNGKQPFRSEVALPVIGQGESVKLSIDSYLELIEGTRKDVDA